jgi:hypothetical protein
MHLHLTAACLHTAARLILKTAGPTLLQQSAHLQDCSRLMFEQARHLPGALLVSIHGSQACTFGRVSTLDLPVSSFTLSAVRLCVNSVTSRIVDALLSPEKVLACAM